MRREAPMSEGLVCAIEEVLQVLKGQSAQLLGLAFVESSFDELTLLFLNADNPIFDRLLDK